MILFFVFAAVFALTFPPLAQFAAAREWIPEVPTFLYETTWLVAIITGILFVYLYRSKRGAWFVQLYLLSMVAKIVAYLVYNTIIVLDAPRHATANVLYFLIVYLAFTVLEIALLYRKISPSTRP